MKRKQKIIYILLMTFFVSMTLMGYYSLAKTNSTNEYRIDCSKESLKLNDEFTVTLITNFNEPTSSIQGRIEFSDDVELDGNSFYVREEFAKEEDLSQIALGKNNRIGFGLVRKTKVDGKDNLVTGTNKILTLKFKVTGSMEKNVVISWKEINKKGSYEIASITIPRSDVNEIIRVPVDENEQNKSEQDAIKDANQTNKEDEAIIKDEDSIENKIKENQEEQITQQAQDNSRYNKNKVLPKTGENYILVVIISVIIAVAVFIVIKYRKSKI